MNMVSFFLDGIEPSSMEEFIIDTEHVSINIKKYPNLQYLVERLNYRALKWESCSR